MTGLISQDKEDHSNFSIILSFCRHCGEEYAGLVPRSIVKLSQKYKKELPKSTLLTSDKQQNLKNLLRDYYQGLCKHILTEHKELQSFEVANKKILQSRGELSSERTMNLEVMQEDFTKLYSSAEVLSDLLNEDLPELPKAVDSDTGGIIIDTPEELSELQLDPWGDDETKSFYLDLPDLRSFLPNYAPKNVKKPFLEI